MREERFETRPLPLPDTDLFACHFADVCGRLAKVEVGSGTYCTDHGTEVLAGNLAEAIGNRSLEVAGFDGIVAAQKAFAR